MKWVHVIAIFLFLILSQNAVDCIENIGVKFNNLTRLPRNGTCTNNCKYYMNLCLSFSESLNCSLFNDTTLTWEIKPGGSKIFALYDQLTDSYEINPIRSLLKTWKMQEVVLLADILRKDTTPIFIEQLRIQGRLPYPINDLGHIDRLQIKNCSAYFCLGVSLYMWCGNIPGCIGIPLHTTTLAVQSSAIAESVSTSYGTSSSVVTTNTYKTTTGIEPSKSVFVHSSYDYNTTSDMRSSSWSVVTTSTYKIMSTTHNPRLSSPSSTVSSCAFETCVQENPNDKFVDDSTLKKVIKSWWFWLCLVAAVVFILFVVVMVKVKYQKRKSRIIQVKDTPKYVEELENYTLADQVAEQATSF